MGFKRTEGFRFTFGKPIEAKYILLIDGKPENLEATKQTCEILDVSPHGMKMFTFHEVGENSNHRIQLEIQFVLDEILIKAIGETVWKKQYAKGFQYGLIFENQPDLEELIVSELKIRRRKEVGIR